MNLNGRAYVLAPAESTYRDPQRFWAESLIDPDLGLLWQWDRANDTCTPEAARVVLRNMPCANELKFGYLTTEIVGILVRWYALRAAAGDLSGRTVAP